MCLLASPYSLNAPTLVVVASGPDASARARRTHRRPRRADPRAPPNGLTFPLAGVAVSDDVTVRGPTRRPAGDVADRRPLYGSAGLPGLPTASGPSITRTGPAQVARYAPDEHAQAAQDSIPEVASFTLVNADPHPGAELALVGNGPGRRPCGVLRQVSRTRTSRVRRTRPPRATACSSRPHAGTPGQARRRRPSGQEGRPERSSMATGHPRPEYAGTRHRPMADAVGQPVLM